MLEETGPDAIAGIASPQLTNEDLFVFKRFMADVLGSPFVDHNPRPNLVGTEAVREALRRSRGR
jgi:predicted molibdopterin-dependent oxidoreductase YjgC